MKKILILINAMILLMGVISTGFIIAEHDILEEKIIHEFTGLTNKTFDVIEDTKPKEDTSIKLKINSIKYDKLMEVANTDKIERYVECEKREGKTIDNETLQIIDKESCYVHILGGNLDFSFKIEKDTKEKMDLEIEQKIEEKINEIYTEVEKKTVYNEIIKYEK